MLKRILGFSRAQTSDSTIPKSFASLNREVLMLKHTLISLAVLATLPTGVMAASSIKIDAKSSMDQFDPAQTAYEATGQDTAVYFKGQTWAMTSDTLTVKSERRGFSIYADSTKATALTVGNENSTIKVELNANDDASADAMGILLLRNPKTGPAPQATFKGKSLVINASNTGNGDIRAIHVGGNTTPQDNKDGYATLDIDSENTIINVTGTNGRALVAMSEGRLNINGNLEVHAEKAIVARGDAIVNINKSGDKVVKLNGDIDFNYDKKTSGTTADATVNVNLSGIDSYWVGNAMTSYGSGEPPAGFDDIKGLTLNIKDGAQWTPTAIVAFERSTSGLKAVPINNMELDGGVINITDNEIDVTVQNMTGKGGTVKLATDLEAEAKTGKFNVTNAAEGSTLDVKLMDKENKNALTSDQIDAEQAKALILNVGGTEVTTTVEEGMYNPAFGIDAAGTTHANSVNSVMQASLELASAAPLAVNRLLMNDVRKRLGDIRTTEETHGAWARYDGGRLKGSDGLKNDFHTIQVGVDTQPASVPVRVGVAFSYTTSDTDFARGSADMDTYSFAGYGVWMGESGQFADIVARVATIETDLTVDSVKKGTMDNVAASLSGEFGWRFDVMNNFFVEPQAELTYTYVNSETLKLSDGSNYSYDSVNSLLGRAGVAFGMACPNNKGNVYARVSAVHEFLGDSKVTGGSGAVHEVDGKDTWVEYGIGANFNLNKSTYFWADVERTSGGTLDEDYRATVGVRYMF